MGRISNISNIQPHVCSSFFTAAVSVTCLPLEAVRVCCNLVSMPCDFVTAVMMLQRRPRRRRHFCNEHLYVEAGIAWRVSRTFSALAPVNRIRCNSVSMSHPRIFLFQTGRVPFLKLLKVNGVFAVHVSRFVGM